MDDNEAKNKDLCNECQQLMSNKDDHDDIECEMCNSWFHIVAV